MTDMKKETKEFFRPKPDDSMKKSPALFWVFGALVVIPVLIGLLCVAK